MIGSNLSHFKITAELGRGGMGEVYRAEDTKLGREVAIKVLPGAFTRDPERLARFEREARVLASLNHPNVAAIYEVGQSEGVRFLAMELAEGEDLTERLASGPIPIEEAMAIALQISRALEAAHDRGIVHRDLKPGNVKLGSDGEVKVLDFGLATAGAKACANAGENAGKTAQGGEPNLPESPTLTAQMTQAGAILGTTGYMSPEQARGQRVDKRSDIWSFGCCLYEMLAGQSAFEAETPSDTLSKILAADPIWARLPSNTPQGVRRLLRRCLEKEPNNRLHDMADARLEIQDFVTGAAPKEELGEAQEEAGVAARGPARWLPWAVAAALGVALIVLLLSPFAPRSVLELPRGAPLSSSINLPNEAPLASTASMPLGDGRTSIALSPDESVLAFVASVAGQNRLYLRDMVSGDFRPVPGTEGAHDPFFSPDGQWVGFFADDKLKKVALGGAQPVELCEATLGFGGSWAADGSIFFSTDYLSGIYSVSSAGGRPQTLVTQGNNWAHFFPHVLPGDRGVLFSYSGRGVGVVDLRTGERKTLTDSGGAPQYSPTGHIVYSGRGSVLAVPFDLERLEVTGTPQILMQGVRTERGGAGQFSLSKSGTLVFAAGLDATLGSLTWLDRRGDTKPMGAPAGDHWQFRISPDGTRVVMTIETAAGVDLWMYDLNQGTTTRVTSDGVSRIPIWTADGSAIFYSRRDAASKRGALYQLLADGSGEADKVLEADGALVANSVSADGRLLFYSLATIANKTDIWVQALDTEGSPAGEPKPVLETAAEELFAAISPDGKWLAYTSDETGGWEVYVRAFPGPGPKHRISTEGGEEPLWSADGSELYYRFGSRWFAARVVEGESFSVTRPEVLFEGPYMNVPHYSYDLSPDGQRFLVVEGPEHTVELAELTVVTNALGLLKPRE